MEACLLINFTLSCQHDQPVGMYSGRLKRGSYVRSNLKKGGLMCSLKEGMVVLGAGPTRKGGVLCAGQVEKEGSTAAHTCTGHICECPPPLRNETWQWISYI